MFYVIKTNYNGHIRQGVFYSLGYSNTLTHSPIHCSTSLIMKMGVSPVYFQNASQVLHQQVRGLINITTTSVWRLNS